MKAFAAYNTLLMKYPWTTKCATAGFLFGLGDFLTQRFIQKTKNYETYRTKKMALFGCFFAAPVLNIWYTSLIPRCTSFIFSSAPSVSPTVRMLTGVFLDQTAFATFFLVCFFVIMDFVDSRSLENATKNLKEKFWPTMIVNWKIWPAAQIINFTVVPLPYRVLYSNSLGLLWNCYLSYAQYRSKAKA